MDRAAVDGWWTGGRTPRDSHGHACPQIPKRRARETTRGTRDHRRRRIRNQQVGGSSPLAGSKTLTKSAILDVAHIELFVSRSAVQVPTVGSKNTNKQRPFLRR
jgi:hypothetical protein